MSGTITKSRMLISASALCLAVSLGAPAVAQDESAPGSGQQAKKEEPIIVTGSRIVSDVGMNSATPVTAVSPEELKTLSPSTLISAISQLPQFYGNSTNDVRNGFFSSPGAGNLNLRGLNTGGGSSRTLTLLNGRRVVPATGQGGVDINILPSALIQRVETVTGGATAAYGTDAVTGAVNFILNTNYNGWEVSAQGGMTDKSDRKNWEISGTWGMDIGDRAHLLLSAEYYHADLVRNLGGRDWYKGYSLINNPLATSANPYEPRYILRPDVVSSVATLGGLICGGPSSCNIPTTSALYRKYFNPDGTLSAFVLGEGTATQAHSITNGGSGDDITKNLAVLAPEAQRASGFAYFDFDATPNLNLFFQGLVGQSMFDQPDHGGRFEATSFDTRITIRRDNAFLPAAVAAIMDAEHLTSFQMNMIGSRETLGRSSRQKQNNLTYSGTLGFKWEIPDGFFEGWRVDGYGQYGHADNTGYQEDVLFDKFFAAIDAVKDSSGKIVCYAATVNPSKWGDCVPLNPFGNGNASSEAIDYVTHFKEGQTITTPLYYQPDGYDSGKTVTFTSGPGKVYNTATTQIMADIAASGTLFDGWAGPVEVAFGASYRKEKIDQVVYDPSNPASDPAIFPAQLAQNAGELRNVPSYARTRSSMMQNSTVPNAHGSYDVKEAFAEIQMPLLRDVPMFQQLNALGAARYADYTASGGVWSWKAGLDWQINDDVRLRGTVSRDVRAATLLERFNQTGTVGTVAYDLANPSLQTGDPRLGFSARTGGNPNLLPEVSKTWTFGAVLQPHWLPGFSVSVDYWKVDIADAIGTLGYQRIVDDCFNNPGTAVCDLVTRTSDGFLQQVKNVSYNIASAAGRGIDAEVSYRTGINLFGGGENLTGRVFWSHLIENSTTTDRTKPATTYFDLAGQTGAGGVLPTDSVTALQAYSVGGFTLSLSERYISAGIYNKRYNVPGARPDVLDNTVPRVIYVNLGASYDWEVGGGMLQVFTDVQNLLDKDPPVVPAVFDAALAQTTSQYNGGLFDLLGRRFTVGVKFKH